MGESPSYWQPAAVHNLSQAWIFCMLRIYLSGLLLSIAVIKILIAAAVDTVMAEISSSQGIASI